ncbi:MAG: hypothetical protein ACRCYU_10380, partial [Nocardioides sp.]
MNTHHPTDPTDPTEQPEHQEETAMTYWPTAPDDHQPTPSPAACAADGDRLHDQAETVYDAIRAMCHHTNGRP